jgi:hypothetical protein
MDPAVYVDTGWEPAAVHHQLAQVEAAANQADGQPAG